MAENTYTENAAFKGKIKAATQPAEIEVSRVTGGKFSGRLRLLILLGGSCLAWGAIIAVLRTLVR